MRAFEAVRAGLRALAQAKAATGAALGAALVASLGLRAALRRAGLDVAAVLHGRTAGVDATLLHAAVTLLLGLAATSLLVDVTRAAALCAYGAPPGAPWGRLGLRRAPAMITLGAVEATVYFALACALAAVWERGAGAVPATARLACLAALACAPVLLIALMLWIAARVAVVLIARGVEAAPALVHGLDVALRRLPSLLRLGGALLVATAPLTVGAIVLATVAPRAAALQLAWAAGVQAAVLWSYAALGAFVGRDARLATG